MRFFKKGQAEMVGLLVIVILLLFVGMIFLRFYLTAPTTSLAQPRQSIEANNVLTALMQVSLAGQPFTEYADNCNSDITACNTLEQEMKQILGIVLRPGQKYSFSLLTSKKTLLKIEQCTTGIVSTYSFIEGNVFYDATLKLC